ncbi:MAG TPA: hypothetical protein VE077_07115 [Candidatus Methylomirabilis sp.]|nr:hypothetical protein [Candidatus Methylomirabilis sp.]
MRRTKQRQLRVRPVRRQREVIRDVMLSAGQCATWLTLEELAKLTHYPPASISAQLRHLRKPRFGAFAVVKRSRRVNPGMRGDGFGTLWEYSVAQSQQATARVAREPQRKKRPARRGRSLNAQARPRVGKATTRKS